MNASRRCTWRKRLARRAAGARKSGAATSRRYPAPQRWSAHANALPLPGRASCLRSCCLLALFAVFAGVAQPGRDVKRFSDTWRRFFTPCRAGLLRTAMAAWPSATQKAAAGVRHRCWRPPAWQPAYPPHCQLHMPLLHYSPRNPSSPCLRASLTPLRASLQQIPALPPATGKQTTTCLQAGHSLVSCACLEDAGVPACLPTHLPSPRAGSACFATFFATYRCDLLACNCRFGTGARGR